MAKLTPQKVIGSFYRMNEVVSARPDSKGYTRKGQSTPGALSANR